jgi:RimJ/RimL family protein N-acetyltransferase
MQDTDPPGGAGVGAAAGDPPRRRSQGPLTGAEVALCRRRGVALAYDPLQAGWVPAAAIDDIEGIDDIDGIDGDAAAQEPAPPPRPPVAGAAPPAIVLRPWDEAEAGRLAALLGDPRVWTYLPEPWPGPLSEETARALIALSNGAGHHRVRAVALAGEAVGQVRLLFGADPAEAEISYWLGPAYWGRGIAAAAVAAFTAECFAADAGLRRIFARVHAGNAASARLLERAGYRAAPAEARQQPWRIWRIERR